MRELPGWPQGLGLHRHLSLDSTNEEARRLAASGERGPLWIVAREQWAGRGRRGRSWVSQNGNLFATLLTRAPPSVAAQAGFAAGLALADTIEAFSPSLHVALKWPNDVVLEGKKAAGILLEIWPADALAIGIGINLAHYPPETEFPAISLAAMTHSAPDPDDVLLRLAGSMAAWYEIWREQGFAPLRTAWLSRAAGLGQPMRVRFAENEMHGVFENLDQDGALVLRSPSGALKRITAGEMFWGT